MYRKTPFSQFNSLLLLHFTDFPTMHKCSHRLGLCSILKHGMLFTQGTAESDIKQPIDVVVDTHTHTIISVSQPIYIYVIGSKTSSWSVLEHMEGGRERGRVRKGDVKMQGALMSGQEVALLFSGSPRFSFQSLSEVCPLQRAASYINMTPCQPKKIYLVWFPFWSQEVLDNSLHFK